MNFNSKGMSAAKSVEILRERGFRYNENSGGFYRPSGKRAGKAMRNGYRTISFSYKNEDYTFCEHRLVWAWFNGDIPDGMVINHIDFDRANNRIENLELCTQSENMRHTLDAGRFAIPNGPDNWKSKFTEHEVQAMKYLRKNGWSNKQVASLFGEKYGNVISRIVKGARYGNVTDAADIMSIYPAIVYHTINKNLTREQQIGNAIAGMCGELGEVVDIIKKELYQGHQPDKDHMIEELGDLLYYITLLLCLIDYNYADTMFNNMDKLMSRYPNGFSEERSQHRAEGDV